MDVYRRRVLTTIAGCVALSGCTGQFEDCDGSEFVVEARPWDGPADATIQYDNLTSKERTFVDPAIADGKYVDCYENEVPEATRRFTDRVLDTQIDGYTYLRRGETSYSLGVFLGDKAYSFVREPETTRTTS